MKEQILGIICLSPVESRYVRSDKMDIDFFKNYTDLYSSICFA